jgi:tetratricopeptide (TPR) repeat protein
MRLNVYFAAAAVLLAVAAGCATSPRVQNADLIRQAENPVWSVKTNQEQLIVSVSPIGQSFQIFGTSAALVGGGVSAMVDARVDRALSPVLATYDPEAVFIESITARLREAFGPELDLTRSFGSATGFADRNEAAAARLSELERQGHDLAVDLSLVYGIYGTGADLIAGIDGEAHELAQQKKVWEDDIIATTEPVLGTERLRDPTARSMRPTFKFTADENAIEKWAQDEGQFFREQYAQVVADAAEALLASLGFEVSAHGHYILGKSDLLHGREEQAENQLRHATELDPNYAPAWNALAVALGRQKEWEEAATASRRATEADAAYGPGWYNRAWVQTHLYDFSAARDAYNRALDLGLAPSREIEKALER